MAIRTSRGLNTRATRNLAKRYEGMPAVQMEYGNIVGQGLPEFMEKQGSFYTGHQLGTGRTMPISTSNLLAENENVLNEILSGNRSMAGYSQPIGDRLMADGRTISPINPGGINFLPYPTARVARRWINNADPIGGLNSISTSQQNLVAYRPLVGSREGVFNNLPSGYTVGPEGQVQRLWRRQAGRIAPVTQLQQPLVQQGNAMVPVQAAYNQAWSDLDRLPFSGRIPNPITQEADDLRQQIISLRKQLGNTIYPRDVIAVAPLNIVQQLDQAGLARPAYTRDVTEQVLGVKPINPNVRRDFRDYNTPVYSYSQLPTTGKQQVLAESMPLRGGYSMTVLPDDNWKAVNARYDSNPEVMLPSSVLEDTVLSPYPLSLGSEVKRSALTAKSSIKADLGNDERLAWMLRTELGNNELPVGMEYVQRMPEYIKYVPKSETNFGQYQETMTDAQDVRDRIAAEARRLSQSARISELQAERTAYPRNPYGVQTYRNSTDRIVPGAMENPSLLSGQQLAAMKVRQQANEMQQRVERADRAINYAYSKFDDDYADGMPQRIGVTTFIDGTPAYKQEAQLSLRDQLELGRKFAGQGEHAGLQPFGRMVSYVPLGGVAMPKGYNVFEVESNNPKTRTQYLQSPTGKELPTPFPIVLVPNAVQAGLGQQSGLYRNTGIQIRHF